MSKNLLILERSSQNLKKLDAPGSKTVLEGVFAEFGVENRNGRVYEEKEYLPHMEYLKKDIQSGNLLGELDHPERFEVALGNVSHRVNELWYDQGDRQVKGKIEVLDTPKGKIAKELLKSGIPLSISSRAAGTVNEDKTVAIQQIYTYDLVAKPGFEKAQLQQVNESEKARINGLIQALNEGHSAFESDKSNLTPEFGVVNENLSIYDVTDKFPTPKYREEALKIANVKNKNEFKPMNENKELSGDALNQWSAFVKSEIGKINERLDSIEDSILSGSGGSSKDVKVLKGYSNQMRKLHEDHLNWTSEIAASVNKLGRYADTLAKKSNEHYKKTEKIEEAVDFNAQVLNHTQDWVGRSAQVINAVCETVDENADMLNSVNEWSEEIAGGVNALNEWGQEKAKAINGIHEWTSSIAQGLNETANWSEQMFGRAMSKSDANKLVQYIELIGEGKKNPKLQSRVNEMLTINGITGKPVNEAIQGLKTLDSVKSVGNVKVDDNASKGSAEFDGKIITAKVKKSGLSKSKKPSELKTITGSDEKVSVGGGSSIKGIQVMDGTKTIKVSTDDGGGIKKKDQNLKLDTSAEGKKVNESAFDRTSSLKERGSKLDEKLAKIMENLENDKAKVNESKQQFPFVSLLSESDQKEFTALSKSDKQKINEAVEKNPTADSGVIKQLWINALTEGVQEEPKWLAAAPAKYKKLYEESDERTKGAIDAMAEYRILESQYQIENFWETSPLAQKASLNEVFTPGDVKSTGKKAKNEDANDPYIKMVQAQMERYQN